jgi:hypothetical protein
LLLPAVLAAQNDGGGNTSTALQKTTSLFYNSVNDNAALYNGFEYIVNDPRIKGDPFFLSTDLQAGDIMYSGTLYTNVPLLFDLTTGNVVVREYGQGILMNLLNQKLSWFTLGGRYFEHIVPDSANKVITNGLYERLYNGAITLYIKREKIIKEDQNTFEKSYEEKSRYFLLKNHVYHAVSDKGSFLDVLNDKKKELTKYLRQENIKYKKDPGYAMAKMAEYYDKLTQ